MLNIHMKKPVAENGGRAAARMRGFNSKKLKDLVFTGRQLSYADKSGKQMKNLAQQAEKEMADSPFPGNVQMVRRDYVGPAQHLGNVHRSAMTGSVYIRGAHSDHDYVMVDCWTREDFQAKPDELVTDPYLCKPMPLKMRTWIYQDIHRQLCIDGAVNNVDNAVIEALEARCVDTNVNTGEWCPAMIHAPALLVTLATGDALALGFGMALVTACIFVNTVVNSAKWWWLARLVTAPVRLLYFVLLLWRASLARSAVATLGFVVLILICFAEFLLGDVSAVSRYRLRLKYKVIRTLPKQVFVCQQVGADHGELQVLSEEITGVPEQVQIEAATRSRIVVVANMSGILVRLLPLGSRDIELFRQHYFRTLGRQIDVLGLDLFDPTCRNAVAMEETMLNMPQVVSLDKKMDRLRAAADEEEDDVAVEDL